jgi:hypothetical protein
LLPLSPACTAGYSLASRILYSHFRPFAYQVSGNQRRRPFLVRSACSPPCTTRRYCTFQLCIIYSLSHLRPRLLFLVLFSLLRQRYFIVRNCSYRPAVVSSYLPRQAFDAAVLIPNRFNIVPSPAGESGTLGLSIGGNQTRSDSIASCSWRRNLVWRPRPSWCGYCPLPDVSRIPNK